VHGSGPQTRWGTLLFLAERFARDGIAALAFDKRGSGESTGDKEAATYDDLAGDAIAAVDFLRGQPGIDPARIGIFGHSEGAMIAPLIASRCSRVAFVIAAAGHAGPLAEQELYRTHNQLLDAGFDETDTRQALAFFATWMNAATTGTGRELVEALVPGAKTQTWFPLVTPPGWENPIWKSYPARATYDALRYWPRVSVPVLLVFGEADRTVDPTTGITRTTRALQDAGNPNVTAVLLPRARHNLTISGSQNPFEWWMLAPGYPDLLSAWIFRARPAL
jgi:alpha-beta hydrolase superfamily lysophospholipase